MSSRRIRSRGQGAVEYLINHAWAVLVIMIVGFAMWRLGVFNVGSGDIKPQVTGFSRLRPLPSSVKLQENGTFMAAFLNGVGAEVHLYNLTLSSKTGSCSTGFMPPIQIPQGDAALVEAGCPALAGKREDMFDLDVREFYRYTLSGVLNERKERGRIRGPYS